MQAGKLRHKIIIQEPTKSNVGGMSTLTWSTYATLHADIMLQQGREYWAAKQVLAVEPLIFDLRYYGGVTQEMRVLYDYKAHDIKSVVNVDERNRRMYIVTVAYDIEYAEFVYSNLSIDDDRIATDTAIVTWDTDFYSDSQVFYLKAGDEDWSSYPETPADTSPRVLSHSVTIPNLLYNAYTIKVRGYNEDGYTPGYSDTAALDYLGPNLSTGPTATPTTTTCLIEWTTDIAAYHRTRYRETGTSEWTVSAWSDSATTSASITIESLDSDTGYDYQVQSCEYGDGTCAFDYSPDPADTFETEVEDLEFSDFYAAGNPMGFLVVGWTTNIATRRKLKWRPKDSGQDWTYTGLTSNYTLTGVVATTMQNIPGKQFEFYPYGITEGGYEEWNSLWYISISGEGVTTVYISE